MTRSPQGSTHRAKSSARGVGVSIFNAWLCSKNNRAAGDRRAFPPNVLVEIKDLACELPARRGHRYWGYSRATRLSPSRLVASWTSTSAVGRISPWDRVITCCVRIKNQHPSPHANIPSLSPAPGVPASPRGTVHRAKLFGPLGMQRTSHALGLLSGPSLIWAIVLRRSELPQEPRQDCSQ